MASRVFMRVDKLNNIERDFASSRLQRSWLSMG